MKKDLATIGGLILLIIFILIFGRGFSSGAFLTGPESTRSAAKKGYVRVTAGDFAVDAKIAQKTNDRKKGLSGQDSLPLSQGMLFIFEQSGTYPFWMKDMKFAIDIIWIDQGKRIVYIAHNAAPQPGEKDSELTLYRPDSAAKYVLEINAGLSSLNNLQIGDEVRFEL